MSMISAQIDELRKWADQLSERENEFGVVVRALVAALRDAADTIWQLRDDLQRANAENAKLRDENARLRSCLSDDADNARQIMAENAKLRELVRDYDRCTMHADCVGCEYDGKLSTHCPLSPCFPDIDELSELGVEVDG